MAAGAGRQEAVRATVESRLRMAAGVIHRVLLTATAVRMPAIVAGTARSSHRARVIVVISHRTGAGVTRPAPTMVTAVKTCVSIVRIFPTADLESVNGVCAAGSRNWK